MKDTVVVFARAVQLGRVKSRLARDIGARQALRFHIATMTRLVRALARDQRFHTLLAVTPDHAYVPFRLTQIPQGRGNLGVRMHRAVWRFPHRRIVIIGCDIPDAGPADVHAAFRALGSADAAFGPAADGGYWLVAMSPRRPARPFASVRWSTEHALTDTLANFAHHRVATILRTLNDVDTADDWRRLNPSQHASRRAERGGAAGASGTATTTRVVL